MYKRIVLKLSGETLAPLPDSGESGHTRDVSRFSGGNRLIFDALVQCPNGDRRPSFPSSRDSGALILGRNLRASPY